MVWWIGKKESKRYKIRDKNRDRGIVKFKDFRKNIQTDLGLVGQRTRFACFREEKIFTACYDMKIKRHGKEPQELRKRKNNQQDLRNKFKVRDEHLVCGKRNRRRKQLWHVIETVIVFLAMY